jgi:carbonic anhydrase
VAGASGVAGAVPRGVAGASRRLDRGFGFNIRFGISIGVGCRHAMKTLAKLFDNNRAWAREMTSQDPEFFSRLSRQQAPQYLWIGCSDSRVPANQIVGLPPGEMFVHRNVANVVVHTDLNCLSTVQFAVDVLRVSHIIVCGHYGCGGVRAALRDDTLGLIDNWLRHVQDVHWKHRALVDALPTEEQRHNRLCELNVTEQALNVAKTTVVREAWARGQAIAVHAWVYDVADGLLRDLDLSVTSEADIRNQDGMQAIRETDAQSVSHPSR